VGETAEQAIARLESILAADVTAYLDAAKTSAEQQEAQLRSLCSSLEFLLQKKLAGSDGWKRSYWIDGIIPASDMIPDAVTITDGEIQIRGIAIWGKGGRRDPFWIEPFYASLCLPAADGSLPAYTLCFGDSARDLATTPYGRHLRRVDWFYPESWLFAFTKGR
jgi:hypothetical protein